MTGQANKAAHGRLPSLTGVRIFAASSVLLVHAFYVPDLYRDSSVHSAVTAALAPLSTCAVSLFFVLSGLILTWTARPQDTAPRFWRRRFARIFPSHLVAMVIATGLVLACGYGASRPADTNPGDFDPVSAVATLFLVQGWVPARDYVMSSVHPVTWSLSCEAFFYLLFPWLLRVVRAVPARWLWRAAGGAALVSLAVPFLAVSLRGPNIAPNVPLSTSEMWVGYVFPVSRLGEFVLGILLARILAAGRWRPLPLYLVLPLPFLAIVPLAFLPSIFAFGPYFAVPVALVVAELASRDIRGARSPLRGRLAVYMGDRSYALYISHYVVIICVRQLLIGPKVTFDPLTATLLVLLVVVPLALAAAWLLHRYVERPAYAALTRRTSTSVGHAEHDGVVDSGGRRKPVGIYRP